MRIPKGIADGCVAVFSRPVELDKTDARLHEAPGEERALSEFVTAVAVARCGFLAVEFEGLPAFRRMNHLKCPLLHAAEISHQLAIRRPHEMSIQLGE